MAPRRKAAKPVVKPPLYDPDGKQTSEDRLMKRFVSAYGQAVQAEEGGVLLPSVRVAFRTGIDDEELVTKLILAGARVGEASVRPLVAALKRAYNQLKRIHVWDAAGFNDECMRILCDFLAGNREIEVLEFLSTSITDVGLSALSEVLPSLTALHTLKFDASRNFTNLGFSGLCGAMMKCRSLTKFSAEYCGLDAVAAETLGEAASVAPIEQLSIVGNDIGAPGVFALASHLSREPRIQNLNLTNCAIGNDIDAAKELAHFLSVAENPITELLLADNFFGEDAGKLLLNALVPLTNVTSLTLPKDVGVEVLKAAKSMLAAHKKALRLARKRRRGRRRQK